jgi:hypothetical protein
MINKIDSDENHSKENNIIKINQNQVTLDSEVLRIKHIRTVNNVEQISEHEYRTGKVEVIQNIEEIPQNNEIIEENANKPKEKQQTKELTKKEKYKKYIEESEDNCQKCPLRCLVCIPICIGYGFIALFDFITYLFVPLFFCSFYAITFIYNSCKNVISSYQVEEEIGFSGAFTSENEIKLYIIESGGAFHLTEILCFSYMSACVKRYFCFIFVLINHILVTILQSWTRAKKCFMTSKIEELYDERVKQIEDESTYKDNANIEPQIELINI